MEQKIRAWLFYISVILFFILLPTILLYSFGYKLDLNRFRLAKTGMIYLQSTPEGAQVYLNGRDLHKSTPVSIEGLMPGEYRVSLNFKSYYAWQQIISVNSSKTTSLDNIVLFPKKPYLDKINNVDIGNFSISSPDKNYAYCLSEDGTALYKVRLNSREHEASLLCNTLDFPSDIKELSVSPDKKKVFFIHDNILDVIYLPKEKLNLQEFKDKNFSTVADSRILYAFWYSDSGRIIIISERSIKIYELLGQGKENTISVLNLRENNTKAFYDSEADTLYFTDIQKGTDGQWHNGLYRLDLGEKSPLAFIKNIEENLK